jgi:Telomeric single stranded DNA binding POT1/CDC13/ssDNA-binding domain of telomere protection protein
MQNELDEVLDRRTQSIRNDLPNKSFCDVNVMGVVISYKPPFRTKRGEWMTNAIIVDDSLGFVQNRISSVSVNLFSKTRDRLPEFKYAGDILRLHRVKVQKWQDEIQLLGVVYSSYVVGRGPNLESIEFTFVPTSKQEWKPEYENIDRFEFLWQWGQRRLLDYPTMNGELDHAFKISDLPFPEDTNDLSNVKITSGDATVMVTSIIENARAGEIVSSFITGHPCGFLRVWDGSGTSHSDRLPLETIAARQSIHDGDPPRVTVIKIASIVNNKIKNIQPPKALVGRVTNVIVWEPEHWKSIKDNVSVGSFIRMRNIVYEMIPNAPSHALQVHSKTSITPLPDNTYEVIQLLIAHSNRVLNGEPFNENSGLLPLQFRQPVSQNGRENPQPRLLSDGDTTIEMPNDQQCPILAELISGHVGRSYTGPAYIKELIPSYAVISSRGIKTIMSDDETPVFQFAVRISLDFEGSNPIDAIAVDAVGRVLFGMTARDASLKADDALYSILQVLHEQTQWIMSVRSVLYDKRKFFLLDQIQRS